MKKKVSSGNLVRFIVRLRLVLALSFLALFLAVSGSYAIGQITAQGFKQSIDAGYQNVADNLLDGLESEFSSRLTDLKIVAGLDTVKSVAVPAGQKREILNRLVELHPEYTFLAITDPSGKILASSQTGLEGVQAAAQPWYVQGKEGPYVGDVHDGSFLSQVQPQAAANKKERYVDLAVPIVASNGVVLGVVGGYLDWSWIQEKVEPSTHPQAEVIILSSSGAVISGPEALLGQTRQLPELAGAVGRLNEPLYAAALASRKGEGIVGHLGWSLVVREHALAAYAPLEQYQASLLRTAIWSTLVLIICAWLLGSYLSVPLLRRVVPAGQVEKRAPSPLPPHDHQIVAEELDVQPRPIHLDDVLHEVLLVLQLTLREKRLRLEVDLDEDLPALRLDPVLMKIILRELLVNAAAHSWEGGRIRVGATLHHLDSPDGEKEHANQEGELMVVIADTGEGVAPRQRAKIFSYEYSMGLAMVKSIVDQTGGEIWFTSKEDKGTVFYVKYPKQGMRWVKTS